MLISEVPTVSESSFPVCRLSPAEQLAVLRESPPAERSARIRRYPSTMRRIYPGSARRAARRTSCLVGGRRTYRSQGLTGVRRRCGWRLDEPAICAPSSEFSVDEAIRYLRIHGRDFARPISDAYVLDAEQRLLGVVLPLDLFSSPANQTIDCVMTRDPTAVSEEADQEVVSRLFREYDLLSVPVVDDFGRMKGVVTVDDIVDVLSEEATEDVQKIGGTGPLDAPYLHTSFSSMVAAGAGG